MHLVRSVSDVAKLRERIRARRRVRAALGCDGTSTRAQLIDADDQREIGNAYGRDSRARLTARLERSTYRERSGRQLVLLPTIQCLDLEHLVHAEQLSALATILARPPADDECIPESSGGRKKRKWTNEINDEAAANSAAAR